MKLLMNSLKFLISGERMIEEYVMNILFILLLAVALIGLIYYIIKAFIITKM